MADRLAAATGLAAGEFLPLPTELELEALKRLLRARGAIGRAWQGVGVFRIAETRRWALGQRLAEAGVPSRLAELALAAFDRRRVRQARP